MKSYEKPYLQPYHLVLTKAVLNPETVKVGESKRIELHPFKFEKIWSISIDTNLLDAQNHMKFFSHYDKDFIDIFSCWTSELRPFETININCQVLGTSKRDGDLIISSPFWKYLLEESKFHLQQEDYHVSILLAAIASECFLYRFLEEELHVIGWSNSKIERYVIDDDVLPSLTNKIDILIKDVLGKKIDDPVYEAWVTYVRDQRNMIMHPKKKLDKRTYGEKSALKAIISSAQLILALLKSVPTDSYQSSLIEDLEQDIEKLKSFLNTKKKNNEN